MSSDIKKNLDSYRDDINGLCGKFFPAEASLREESFEYVFSTLSGKKGHPLLENWYDQGFGQIYLFKVTIRLLYCFVIVRYLPDIKVLCKKHFPNHPIMEEGALDYVLHGLREKNFFRLKKWRRDGSRRSYLLKIVSNLLIDLSREKYGHFRPPKKVQEHSDDLVREAYKLRVKSRLSVAHVLEILNLRHPEAEYKRIQQAVREVDQSNPRYPLEEEVTGSSDDIASNVDFEPIPVSADIEEKIENQYRFVLELLMDTLITGQYSEASENTEISLSEDMKEFFFELKQRISLSAEECTFLRMHYLDGLSLNNAAAMSDVSGNPYRFRDALLNRIRDQVTDYLEKGNKWKL